LLSAATTAHGGSETPALDVDSVEYEKLMAWVVSLDQHPNRLDQKNEAVLAEPARFDDRQIANDYAKPIEKPASMHPTDSDRRPMNHLDVPPTIGAIPDLETRPAAFIPRDEFDPEIFHRMSSDRD
jgi:hypothetical protein